MTGDAAFGLLEVAGIEGLDAWLTSFSLDRYLPDTILWCYEEGVSSLQEVFKNWEQLVDALNLKPLGRTRMSQDPRCPARAEFPPGSLPMHPAVIPPGSLPTVMWYDDDWRSVSGYSSPCDFDDFHDYDPRDDYDPWDDYNPWDGFDPRDGYDHDSNESSV
jgi:hypothetical protein